jgi:hypothetical protein
MRLRPASTASNARVAGGDLLGPPVEHGDVRETAIGGAPPGERQHVWTEIDRGHATARADERGGSLGHGAGAGAEVEHALGRCERRAGDHGLDDRRESPIDLP